MQHLDEGTIHAWLDGALSPDEAARAEAHVGSCSMCADATAEARGLIAAASRILTALDDVPSVRVSPGVQRDRRSLTTWLVREKIAAVLTLVVAGGALALVMARNTPEASIVDLASEPVRTFELAAADSPTPPPVAAEESVDKAQTNARAAVRVAPASPPPARGAVSNREGDAAPTISVLQRGPTLMADAASASAAGTDDSVRSVTVATERAEARVAAQAGSSTAEKVVGGLARRRTADASARYAEPRPAAPAAGGATGVAPLAEGPRLVQEEKMTEGGREVRRRIYSVDGILVTLDERAPGVEVLELEQRPAANAPRRDSTTVSMTIRWTDASGKEFTLTGAAPAERLERIRKLLGF